MTHVVLLIFELGQEFLNNHPDAKKEGVEKPKEPSGAPEE